MTKLLDRAIAKARALTEAEQDEAAELLLWAMGDPHRRSNDEALAYSAGMERGRRIEWAKSEAGDVFAER